MTDRINGGSPTVSPQLYQTVPTAIISEAEQRDRYLNSSELQQLSAFFSSGLQRLEIAATLSRQALPIIAAGANRIFTGGSPMDYLELPTDPVGLPGSGYYVGDDFLASAMRRRREAAAQRTQVDPFNPLREWFKNLTAGDRPSVPSRFRTIDVGRYGQARMRRSMRDLDWFLRYVTYAIATGDTSIITVNTRGLRGVIPEDATLATVVALREMQWKALTYFPAKSAAAQLVQRYFDVLITDYQVEKPSPRLRPGVSRHHPGLQLPQSYGTPLRRWVLRAELPDAEQEEALAAVYRQVFERDVRPLYGTSLAPLASQVKSGQFTLKEFIRQLGKSRLYRQLFYEPYSISRAIELACRHFLGRGLSCLEEFRDYFERVSEAGFPALVDALVDSPEYADYFGEDTVPYLRGLGLEAQECRSWGPQLELFRHSAPARRVPQFLTTFAGYQQPLPNQHPYGVGHDPLEIQFGAIFPQATRHPKAQPAHFSEDSRRILIGRWTGRAHADPHAPWGQLPGSQPPVLLPPRLPALVDDSEPSHNVDGRRYSTEAVILATYRQVFGREVLASQRHTLAESQLNSGLITVRELVRQLAKSRTFRRLYWEELYITQAIEIIHRRLLGRPTRERRELNRYYDICARQGFYALIDALIDSDEYRRVFGENTVPYERYVTPRGLALRIPHGPSGWFQPRQNPATAGAALQRYGHGHGHGNGATRSAVQVAPSPSAAPSPNGDRAPAEASGSKATEAASVATPSEASSSD